MDAEINRKKNKNPRENANPISAATFFYTFPTFIKGYKNEFKEGDLYESLKDHKSSLLGNQIEKSWDEELVNSKKANRQPSLKRVLLKTFGLKFLLLACVLILCDIIIKLSQPLFLGQLISYYTVSHDNESTIDKKDAYYYAGGVIICSLLEVLLTHPYMMGVSHMGMKVRIAVCSLIYRKALRLSKTSLSETTVGQLVNLLSNDVNRFDYASIFANHTWVSPIQTCVVCYLMYQKVGVSAVLGIFSLVLFIPLEIILAKISSVYRLKTAVRTDERVRLMNEIISGIQVIKMYTWEIPFGKLASKARRFEIKAIRVASCIKGIYTSFLMFASRTALFITILVYVLSGFSINAQQIFILMSYYDILRLSMTIFFPQGVGLVAETIISINRLNKFLLYGETSATPIEEIKETNNENAISIENATAKWVEASSNHIFTNLDLHVKRGALISVVGPVGSGKTSLLHVILRELPLITGVLKISGRLSYASQEPWLFTGSVRQNILFGQEYDKQKYNTVVKQCSLERDFNLFPYGDKTIVGERGVSLSGGQRARINLARAVYKEADIYLLDDPLSAVDTHVGKELFENCIRQHLKYKTVILITHQLQYLKDVDQIIILDEGVIKTQGTFTELQSSGLNFAKLLRIESESEDEEEFEEILLRKLSIKRRLSVTSGSSLYLEDPTVVEEQISSGTVSTFVYKSYINAAGNYIVILGLFLLLIVTQAVSTMADYFMTIWVNLEQRKLEDETLEDEGFTTEAAVWIFLGITIALIILAISRSIAFFSVCMNASVNLHDGMFNSLLKTTMRFFNTNSSGRILNRFSKDIGAIDERLPVAVIECTQMGLGLLAIVIVVSTVNYWLVIPTIVMALLFVAIRAFYMTTCRAVKRLEGVTRSPVFSHLNASLQGLTTIRASGAQDMLEKEFDNHQDLHSSAWYIFLSTSTAFGYWLDLICVVYIAIVTLSFLVFNTEQYGGNVGLAITQSLVLTGALQWCMRQTSELETQMTSVERVLEYTTLDSEPGLEKSNIKAPKSWPKYGAIIFSNMCLKYSLEDPPVLKNLNLTIKPLEKIGIVGRTGAGKSSLIAALFRFTHIEGSIIIDEIDTRDLCLHDLRSKISIIPQEPVLFSGTLRYNLDPFDEYDDNILWQALEDVELKEIISDMPLGLNGKMSEGGSNFSVGQRQLICLARAIIRNNKILILDEATANIDPQTDALIQQTIRKKFANCTVLTIAHRLNTVMDSDKILVMDAGKMVEFDHPYALLQNKQGYFYSMLQQTGKNMIDSLTKIAENSYNETSDITRL